MEKIADVLKAEWQSCQPKANTEPPTSSSKSEPESDSSAGDYIRANLKKIMTARKCPEIFLDADLLQFPQSITSRFNPRGSYLITGPCGLGKSYLAAAMMKAVVIFFADKAYFSGECLRMYNVQFVSVPELLLTIKETFEPGSERSEADVIYWFAKADLLVMDDLGAEKVSDWVLQTLYTIIDMRSRERKQTIITSNLDLDALGKKLSDRIASRIRGLCIHIALNGKDRRIVDGKSAAAGDYHGND